MKIRMAAGMSRAGGSFMHSAVIKEDGHYPSEEQAIDLMAKMCWEPFIVEMEVPDPIVWDKSMLKLVKAQVTNVD